MNHSKSFALSLILTLSVTFVHAQWLTNYSYRKKVTIHSSQVVGSSDFNDFPVLINLTDSDLQTDFGCDKVKNLEAYDVAVTKSDGVSMLEYEIDHYDPALGLLSVWVKITSLSASIDTEIYLYFGRRGVSSDPSLASTWNSDHRGVWHFSEDPSETAPQILGSTANSLNQTSNGSMTDTDLVQSKIGVGLDFDGTNDFLIRDNDPQLDFGTGSFSVGGWFKTNGTTGTSFVSTCEITITDEDDDAEQRGADMYLSSSDLEFGHSENGEQQIIGMRFASVCVPTGATIVDAYIELTGDDEAALGTDQTTLLFYGEDVANSVAFSSSDKISTRTKTSSFAWWSNLSTWTSGAKYQSPSLREIVQEIVDNGWVNGNPMTFMVEGFGYRLAASADNSPAGQGPKLVVSYESSGGTIALPNQAITSNSDDVEENLSDASANVLRTGNDLELGNDGSKVQEIGLRFDGMAIPQGATIQSATITFTAKGSSSSASDLVIYGEKTGNSAGYSFTPLNVSNRTKTSSSVSWPSIPTWANDVTYQTPSVVDIIQEIVNQSDWSSGNALALMLSGTGTRRAYSRDGSSSRAPYLTVSYTLPSTNGNQYIATRYDDNGYKVWFGDDARLHFGIDDDATWDPASITSVSTFKDDDWHHFVASKHGTDSLSLLIDGVLEGTKGTTSKVILQSMDASSDDAEQSGSSVGTSGTLEFDGDMVGLRFPNIDIAPGAEILSVTVSFTANGDNTSGTTVAQVYGSYEKSTFASSSNNISDRLTPGVATTATENWTFTGWENNGVYYTPDLSSIVQEIINNGWTQGDPLVFVFETSASTGTRKAESKDSNSGRTAPHILIEYRDVAIGPLSSSSAKLILGADGQSGTGFLMGSLDELRLMDYPVAGIDWFKTEYNNQNDPGSFYTVSSLERITWNGSINNEWATASNWSFGGAAGTVPWADADIFIPSGAASILTLDANRSVSNITISAGSQLDIEDKTLTVGCHFENNGTFNTTTGTVEFDGDSTQFILGSSAISFYDLHVANSGQSVIMQRDIIVENDLRFTTAGFIDLNSNTFTLDDGTISNLDTDLDKYLILNGSSVLTINGVNNNETALFPVGYSSDPHDYARVDILNKDVSTSFSVGLCDTVYDDGTCDGSGGGAVVSSGGVAFLWNINSTSTNAEVTLYWDNVNGVMSGFNRNLSSVNHYSSGDNEWQALESYGAATHFAGNVYYNSGGTTSFSPFGVSSNVGPLPIELQEFTALLVDEEVQLKWVTASETNNDFFTLERSIDGNDFQPMDKINGAGNSNETHVYNYTDNNPYVGRSYYRLRQTDYDGTESTSSIEIIDYQNNDLIEVVLYPNPSYSGAMQMEIINAAPGEEIEMQVLTIEGTSLVTKNLTSNSAGIISEQVVKQNSLKPGAYLIKLQMGQKVAYHRIIIN